MRIALKEGLGSYLFGRYLRRALEEDLKKLGHTVVVYPWSEKVLPKFDVIIGHSFGGGYAIKYDHKCKVLITLDARRWDFWNNSKLNRPYSPEVHVNFYQENGLRGYSVNGANRNQRVISSHLKLPRTVKLEVLEIIGSLN